ncbi:MAG: hypothetical protein IBX64_09305 [Actinobacteria bacterium]|nr:hypothetical protein [Actinomycetota bacterium]
METGPVDELKMAYRTAAIISVAFVLALFLYAGVVEILLSTGFDPAPGADLAGVLGILRYAFLAISIAVLFLARFAKNFALSGKLPIQALSQGEVPFLEPIIRLRSALLITLAFSEVPALFGFILFIFGGSRLDFYTFLAISFLSSYIYFPRYNQWEEWIRGQAIKGVNMGKIR